MEDFLSLRQLLSHLQKNKTSETVHIILSKYSEWNYVHPILEACIQLERVDMIVAALAYVPENKYQAKLNYILRYAVSRNLGDIIDSSLSMGADINHKEYYYPAVFCALENHTTMDNLLEKGVDLSITSTSGESIFHRLVSRQPFNKDMFDKLLIHGANLQVVWKKNYLEQYSVFSWAVESRSYEYAAYIFDIAGASDSDLKMVHMGNKQFDSYISVVQIASNCTSDFLDRYLSLRSNVKKVVRRIMKNKYIPEDIRIRLESYLIKRD